MILRIIAGAALAALAGGCSSQAPQQGATATQGATLVPVAATRVAERPQPVAIELFTSQGCSSCPPADRLATQLARNPDLVIMTRAVTYWDRLGWRDTLGREENTALQRGYARNLRSGGGRSYTPQIVVDGRVGMVGSRRAEIASAIDDARDASANIAIRVADGSLRLDGSIPGEALVQLVDLDPEETVAIGRGENRGRSITYTNVVRDEHALGRWRGGAPRFELPAAQPGMRRAVIVRQGEAGPILAARYL